MSRHSFLSSVSVRVTFSSPHPERILNEILKRNLPVWGIEQGEGSVSFFVFPSRIRYFESFRKGLGEQEEWREEPFGILHLLYLFRRRFGFFAGLLFLAVTIPLSTCFLWGVEVVGNVEVPEYKICNQLKEYGLSPGKLLSRLDAKEIALRFGIEHSEYLYVGINVIGTRARVEIREREKYEENEPVQEENSNLVAETYGKISRYEVLSGKIEVKKGDYVTQGALLISGVCETKNGAFYPVRASGRVFAETNRTFSVTVPTKECYRAYEGDENKQVSYEVLGLSLSFPPFSTAPKKGERVLEFAEPLCFFGYRLPVVVREKIFLNSVEKKEEIEVDRAEKLAYDKYEQFKRDTFAESDEILWENVTLSTDEQGVTLTAELSAIEDICREVPFRFTTFPEEN